MSGSANSLQKISVQMSANIPF